jgi:hypothetical protein
MNCIYLNKNMKKILSFAQHTNTRAYVYVFMERRALDC